MFLNKMEIEKLNYYAWARFLEKVNDDDALIRVLEKLDMATPQRKDLSMYRDILFNEFQEDRCFYCGKKLDKKIHVDHFIPWTFVKNDNLWNFVLACPKCNLKKSGNLACRNYVAKIGNRNSFIVNNTISNPAIRIEFDGYYDGLLDRMWSYAKMSGIRERDWIAEVQLKVVHQCLPKTYKGETEDFASVFYLIKMFAKNNAIN